MENFITLIICVFCIINIILFFKVWSMTNNVATIKQKYLKTYLKRCEIHKIVNNPFYTKEDKSKILYDNMFNELYEVVYILDVSVNKVEELNEIKTFYTRQFNKISIDVPIIPSTIEEFRTLLD